MVEFWRNIVSRRFNGWPELDEEAAAKFEKGDAATAVGGAIESSVYEGDVISPA
jgi:hypothetical protein